MRIGLDFDNTIVCYDQVFHKVALERKVISAAVPVSKLAVRDELRIRDCEDVWTKMQGYVYGRRMNDAEPYPGVLDFLQAARAQGHELFIISNKTRTPFMGPQYDLHAAASEWIDCVLRDLQGRLVARDNVFFRETKEEKIAQIAALHCDVFIDDLPEILNARSFPENVRKLLFDLEGHHGETPGFECVSNWREIRGLLLS